jgi:hypothetical protein
MPTPPAYLNASYYMFHPSQARVPLTKRSPAPSNASTQRSKKGKNTNDDSEDDGIPKFKKEFERFHSENGVRTVMGSIGPVQNGIVGTFKYYFHEPTFDLHILQFECSLNQVTGTFTFPASSPSSMGSSLSMQFQEIMAMEAL